MDYCNCEFPEPYSAHITDNRVDIKCFKCNKLVEYPIKKWEKEFEDRIFYNDGFNFYDIEMYDLVEKYLGCSAYVKIKCKDGCIQIERIK